MKVHHLLEELRPLLLDLIQQRVAKKERVFLDFWAPSKVPGAAMDFIEGAVHEVDGNFVYFHSPGMMPQRRFAFAPDADDRYRLDRVKDGWKVRSIKTKVAESDGDSLLKTIILQRIARHEPVKLDFWHEGFTFKGYITLVRGNTIHTMYTKRNGETETERFVLMPNADDFFTLRKLNGEWVVQGI